MARRSMAGQLNMFDFFSNLEDAPLGEVEMVSLMPSFEEEETEEEVVLEVEPEEEPEEEVVPEVESEVVEEPVIIEEPQVRRTSLGDDGKVVMSRSYEKQGEKIEIAYMNYNKVCIIRGKEEPIIKVFASSKEAVDFYVQEMQTLEED